MGAGFLDVLHGHQADAAIGIVDHQQLLNAVLVQQFHGLIAFDVFGNGDEAFLGHQLTDRLVGIGGKAHIAVGEDTHQLAGIALDHREAGNAVLLAQALGVGKRLVREDGDRIDHHAGFELLHLAHFLRLDVDAEIFVNDADAAGLGHGDGEAAFGDRIHGGRNQRNVEGDGFCEAGRGVGLRRENRGGRRHKEDVVKRQCFGNLHATSGLCPLCSRALKKVAGYDMN